MKLIYTLIALISAVTILVALSIGLTLPLGVQCIFILLDGILIGILAEHISTHKKDKDSW
jgi:arginine exporter protein ArgO